MHDGQRAGHHDDEPDLYRVGKKSAGAMLDGEALAWVEKATEPLE